MPDKIAKDNVAAVEPKVNPVDPCVHWLSSTVCEQVIGWTCNATVPSGTVPVGITQDAA